MAIKLEEKSNVHRRSNIELLRIISMVIIVAHHYVVNSGLLSCIDAKSSLDAIDYFLLIFGWGGKTAINCFVLVTGYFMCTSNITKNKFFKLLREYYFYTVIIWCLFFFSKYETFSIKSLLKMLFPFFAVSDDFISCFLLFYLLIPFINKLIHSLTEREHLKLILWCLAVYVVLSSFAMANVVFNYVTWFSIIYILASYIRLYSKAWMENRRVIGILMVFTLLCSWLSVVILAGISRKMGIRIDICYFFLADSNKILALATSVSMFLFFKNLKIGQHRIINLIAASTFGVLLIHANSDMMRRWLWNDICNNIGMYENGNSVYHAIGCVMIIYIVCTLIDMIRIRLGDIIENKIKGYCKLRIK